MDIRPFAYSYFDNSVNVAGSPHGLLRQDGGHTYPDRGAYNLHGYFYAYPLCATDNFLICCRTDFGKDNVGVVVYAAPFRSYFTYRLSSSGNSAGVRGFLYQEGYAPADVDRTSSTIPGALIVGQRPVAMSVEGDVAVVGWATSGGVCGLSLCTPLGSSQHLTIDLGVIAKPTAIAIDKNRMAYLAVQTSGGVMLSAGVSLDSFTGSDLEFPDTPVAVDPDKPSLGALALIGAKLGANLIKAVATAPAIRDVGEGPSIEGVAQWLIGPLGSGVAQLYGPQAASSDSELPEMTYEEGYFNPVLQSGQLTYSLVGSTLTYSDALTTEEWNPQAAYSALWPAWPVINAMCIDALLIIPETPLFWRNLVQATEQP